MNRLLPKLDMDREEELHFFYFTFLFPLLVFKEKIVLLLHYVDTHFLSETTQT
jgi:hypothetical protein